uniref:Clusterin-associated protein 1 n=1 Tax=Syphacia muris TaxID=451379 RepID=A0A0N5AWR3_9BILA
MSYREIRNFVEMLRVLGYPRLVSMENFRKPNFNLVAELLRWIVGRFNPNSRLPDALTTEQERVVFIKSVVFCLLQSARIKLNPKKLYQADGYAVQELIVPVQILYNAPLTMNLQLQNIMLCRQLASTIPTQGAAIYDLLGKEPYAKVNELDQVEKNVSNISADEQALKEKIIRKQSEYDQHQKRLAKLQAFRPQHMDEYEKHEAKLKQMYEVYVVKFRNLCYLQNMLVGDYINFVFGLARTFGHITGAGLVDDDNDDDDDDDDDEEDNKNIENEANSTTAQVASLEVTNNFHIP